MKAAEATIETTENFMISVVQVVDVNIFKGVWFEEYLTSPRFYTSHSNLKIPLHMLSALIEALGVVLYHI